MKINEIVRKLAEKVFQMGNKIGNIEQVDTSFSNFKQALALIENKKDVQKTFFLQCGTLSDCLNMLNNLSSTQLSMIFNGTAPGSTDANITFNLFARNNDDTTYNMQPVYISCNSSNQISFWTVGSDQTIKALNRTAIISGQIFISFTYDPGR